MYIFLKLLQLNLISDLGLYIFTIFSENGNNSKTNINTNIKQINKDFKIFF